MKKSIVILTAAILAASSLTAEAARSGHGKQNHRKAAAAPTQIACTAIGCVPVPRGCGQTAGRTWSGMPTGNDIIVCPPGVAPFR